MANGIKKSRWAWLGLGLMIGCLASLVVPRSPLHAVGNASTDDFAVCTAVIDQHGEALLTLDSLTGDLSAITLNTTGGFNQPLKANVAKDMKLEPGKKPKFLLMSGNFDMHSQGQTSFAQTVIYVIETNSGLMMVYGVPATRNGAAQALVPLLPAAVPVRGPSRS